MQKFKKILLPKGTFCDAFYGILGKFCYGGPTSGPWIPGF